MDVPAVTYRSHIGVSSHFWPRAVTVTRPNRRKTSEREKPKQSKTLQMHFSADVTEPLEIHQDVETTRPSCLQHVAHVHHTQRGGGESEDSTEKCFVTVTEPQNIHFLPSSIFWGEL